MARVTTAGGTDGWGDPIPGETVETAFYGDLQPLSSVEKVTAGLDRAIDTFRLFMPASVQLDAKATIAVDGVEYQLEGTPEPHRLNGRVHHYEALAKRVSQ